MVKLLSLAALAVVAMIVTGLSWYNSRQGRFYSDTHVLGWLGIYVWGDGLVLGPFWVLMAAWLWFASARLGMASIVVFFLVRSAYEVVYWLVHQTTQRDYKPPVLRNITWIDANAAAIVYQVFHTCMIVIMAVILLWLLGVQ